NKKNGYQGARVTCPHCDHAAPYHGQRQHTLVGLCGDLSCRRAYYYCRRCAQGFFPFDPQAGITTRRLTPAAEPLAALAGGVSDSFEKAGQLLHEMAGVRLSESTVERTTEDVGDRIAGLLGRGITFGPDLPWRWHRDAQGRTVASFTIDATGT